MSKRHADSTPDEKAPNGTTLSADEVLVEAARNGDTTAVRTGLEQLSPDTDSKTVAFDAVHEACRGNRDECLALLLPYVETTQMGFGMLLSECIHADHTACTEVLLQHWKSVCSNVAFVPHGKEEEEDQPCPAMWEDPAVCQVLIDAGADIETKDDMGRSPLLLACFSDKFHATVKMLVEASADVCVTDNEGDTCLTLAAWNGQTETVRYLVGLKNVDMNHKAADCCSALHCAVDGKYPDVAKVLIDAGADIEAKNNLGRSPLHLASENGELALVKILVRAGAEVCVADNEGDTCLTLAAWFGQTETVRYLVSLPEVDMNQRGLRGRTALHMAVLKVHADVVEVLIDAGADIEVKSENESSPLPFGADIEGDNGDSPLHLASQFGETAIVKMLVEAGAGVRVTNNEGDTCLILAAHFGHTETVRYLVGLPEVDVNQRTKEGWLPGTGGRTALHSLEYVDTDVVEVLIDAGADIEAKDPCGQSPLHCASEKGEIAIVKVLVEAGAEVCARDNYGNTCLKCAACYGHTETVRYLVGLKEVDVNQRDCMGCTALRSTAGTVHADVVEVLIDAGADIEAKDDVGYSPIRWACIHGYIAVVKVLLKAGAKVCHADNEGDYTCLDLAANNGRTETVRYLASLREVDVNHQGFQNRTALHIAVSNGRVNVVEVLIDAGADIEAKDVKGLTPLHYACDAGKLEIVQMLVEAGADVRVADNEGETCLNRAANDGRTETVRYLASLREADVIRQGFQNRTALHTAVSSGHVNVVEVLIDAGADIEAKNVNGRTLLHYACDAGKLEIVQMLVEAGADVRVADNNGHTCLMLAGANGHAETVCYLVNSKEVDVKQTDRLGNTALEAALEQGNVMKEEKQRRVKGTRRRRRAWKRHNAKMERRCAEVDESGNGRRSEGSYYSRLRALPHSK